MKAVYSLWSKPVVMNNDAGGFFDIQSFYCSWLLSVRLAQKHFKTVVLYTDRKGFEMLQPLNLRFDEVHIVLDKLNDFPCDFWAIGKIYTYSKQTKPFVHIDSDVYLWDGIKGLENADILIQDIEGTDWPFYQGLLQNYLSNTKVPNQDIAKFVNRNSAEYTYAFNCGVFGGCNIDYIKHYSLNALHIAKEVSQYDWEGQCVNLLFEQYLAGMVAMNMNIKPTCIMQSNLKYTHILGGSKKIESTADKLKQRVKKDYPRDYLIIKRLNECTVND